MTAVTAAAKWKTPGAVPEGLFALAAKPHPGHQPSVRTLHQAIAYSKPVKATRLPVSLYDFRSGPRCTGKPRDYESGLQLDYFGARYFSGAQGRFTSPDKPFADQHPEDPQSWNLYSYVRNNPLRLVDDTGEGAKEGIWKGVQNWFNHTGEGFVSLVFEPQEAIPTAIGGLARTAYALSTIEGQIGLATDFAMLSSDDKIAAVTEVALSLGTAAAVGGAIKGTSSLTTLGTIEVEGGGGLLTGTNVPGQVTSRASFRKATVQNAWDNAAEGPTGGRLCPTCQAERKAAPGSGQARDWDINHRLAWTKRTFPANVRRKQVIENYQEGTELECPICNRRGGNKDR